MSLRYLAMSQLFPLGRQRHLKRGGPISRQLQEVLKQNLSLTCACECKETWERSTPTTSARTKQLAFLMRDLPEPWSITRSKNIRNAKGCHMFFCIMVIILRTIPIPVLRSPSHLKEFKLDMWVARRPTSKKVSVWHFKYRKVCPHTWSTSITLLDKNTRLSAVMYA